MKDTLSPENIAYGVLILILINIISFFTGIVDIIAVRNIKVVISIGFPICLLLLAFFCGFKNKVGFKSYIVITLFLSLLLGFLQLWEPLRYISIASFASLRNLIYYIFNKGALSDYYHNNMSTNIKTGLIVEIVYLGIMFLSYQGGYIASKTLKGKHKTT